MARWAGIEQLSEYLNGKSVHTLRKMVQQGRLPHYRLGRQLLFDLDEVDELIRNPTTVLLARQLKEKADADSSDVITDVQPSDQHPETTRSTPAERAQAGRIATDIWSEA